MPEPAEKPGATFSLLKEVILEGTCKLFAVTLFALVFGDYSRGVVQIPCEKVNIIMMSGGLSMIIHNKGLE